MQDYFFPFYATILVCKIFVLMEGNLFRLKRSWEEIVFSQPWAVCCFWQEPKKKEKV